MRTVGLNKSRRKFCSLPTDQVHLWHVPFNQKFDERILSVDERLRANRNRFFLHKSQFMMYRCALRQILALYFDQKPEKLLFGYTKYGKPYILTNPQKIQFNLSHSSDMAVLGVTKSCQIGVDVECIQPLEDMQAIAKDFFSKDEFCKFIALPEIRRLEAFYELWTRKEAFVKAIGEGLSHPLDTFTVSFSNKKTPKMVEIDHSEREANQWSLKSFDLQIGRKSYKIACVVKNRVCKVKKYRLE